MTRHILTVISAVVLLAPAGAAHAKTPKPVTVKIKTIDAKGVGKQIGTVTIKQTADGLELKPKLKKLTPGEHGLHIHENGSCDPADKDGAPTAGQAAGGHFDPDKTGAHKGPAGGGHKGDLPLLTVDAKGKASGKLTIAGLTLADVLGKSLMIHEGGDNYSDTPKPLGGGGGRIACGIIGKAPKSSKPADAAKAPAPTPAK